MLYRPSSYHHPTDVLPLDATSRLVGYKHRLLPKTPGRDRRGPPQVPCPPSAPAALPFQRVRRRLRFQVVGTPRGFPRPGALLSLERLATRTYRFLVVLRPGQLLPQKEPLTLGLGVGRFPRRRQSSIRPPSNYPYRTCTGWQTRACRWSHHLHHLFISIISITFSPVPTPWAHATTTRLESNDGARKNAGNRRLIGKEAAG